jgi:hypothetical protein
MPKFPLLPKRKKSGFVSPLVIAVPLVIGLGLLFTVIGIGIFRKSPVTSIFHNQSQLKPKTESGRVRGNAAETAPYGDIKDDKVTSNLIGPEGGVVTADLAGNVKAYLVVPPGYSDPEGNVYKLTPYFSMPTSKNAPALPADLGFGVDFEIENLNHDSIEPLFLVFDLDQGRTVNKILKDKKLNGVCLPTVPWFDPMGCAFLNNIPITSHTSNLYAVVSPIRDVQYNQLMFMNNTVPVGFDNLIVTEITNQATFIPVKLSRDVLVDLIRANKPGFTMPQTEAMVSSVKYGIIADDPLDIPGLGSLFRSGSILQALKVIDILPQIPAYLASVKNKMSSVKSKTQNMGSVIEGIQRQITDFPEEKKNYLEAFNQMFIDASGISSGRSAQTLTAVFINRRLEKAGYPDAAKIRQQMAENIEKDLDFYLQDTDSFGVNEYDMLRAEIWLRPEWFSQARLTGLFSPVQAVDLTCHVVSEGSRNLADLGSRMASAPLGNKCGVSYGQVVRAMMIADMYDCPGIKDALMDLLKKMITDSLCFKSGQSIHDVAMEWQLSQLAGLDADNACVNDMYRDKLLNASYVYHCTTLMEKNLKNFAWNELKCEKVLKPSDSPAPPPNCPVCPSKPSCAED